MERIYFTSDVHFWHKNILRFCPTTRKGNTVEEMNELLIENWNKQVQPNDRVYCLGDTFFCDAEKAIAIMKRLNGRIHLVYGNHDNVIRSNGTLRDMFESVSDYKEIKIGDQLVCMFHYPVWEWRNMHYGSYMFYGHIHNEIAPIPGRNMNVGIDTRPAGDMTLWSWEELDAMMKTREIRMHHKKSAM